MWKFLSRFRSTICERGILPNCTTTATSTDQGSTNPVSQEVGKKFNLPCPFRAIPCFLEACQRQLTNYYGQHVAEQPSNNDGGSSDGKNSTGDSFRSENINFHQPCAILGAVGWSGVLVLGWTILQPWYRQGERTRIDRLVDNDVKIDCTKRYIGLCNLLLHPALSQPNYILPSTSAIKSDNRPELTDATSNVEVEEKCLTPEEAFDEAANELKRVHERIVGEAENRRGVACLSHKQNHQAIEHFRNASNLKHASGAFNLGQCYELGMGTNQDFTQAAHWYKVASELGHPTAMYNLGVFYAHGWGGLKADSLKAKQLFLTAAARGQPEAQSALNLKYKKDIDNDLKSDVENISGSDISSDAGSVESRLAFDFFKMNNIRLKFTNSKDKKNDSSKYRPDSSLPSSSPPSTLSSSPVSSITENPLMFNQRISTIEESPEEYSEMSSSDDDWQAAADIASLNGNATTLYRLAVCYESSHSVDPKLVLQLFRMAADHGHFKAKHRVKILEEHYSKGTLTSFLRSSIKKDSKHSSVSSCSLNE